MERVMASRRRRFDPKAQEKFAATNAKGADTFGTLWLAATQAVVDTFRAFGYSDELETDYGMRTAVAAGIYKTLSLATRHPVNLSRGADKIAERLAREEEKGAD